MSNAATEARVLDHLLDQVAADRATNSLWVPQKLVATTTPLDIVRGIAAQHPWPAEWERELRDLSPISQEHSWLSGAWLNIANRWVLYENVPYPLIPEGKRVQLGGTPYWEMPKHLRAGRKASVSAFQWEMYRKHQVWARPFWVIQGTEGGTPAKFTDVEEAILQAKGLDTEPPEAGALPYAEWDNRVVSQIRHRDRLTKMQARIERLRATADTDALKAEQVLAEEVFRKEFWGWFEERMQPQAEFWTWYTAREEAQHLPIRQASQAEAKAAEDAKEQYLTTGAVPVVFPWQKTD